MREVEAVIGNTSAEALLAAIRDKANGNADGQTFDELRAASGWGDKRLRRQLKAIQSEGRLKTGRREGMNLAGQKMFSPVYLICHKPSKSRRGCNRRSGGTAKCSVSRISG